MKLVRFFELSRDKWKAKHHKVKQELKLMGNQVRAVEKSRAHWKEVAQQNNAWVERASSMILFSTGLSVFTVTALLYMINSGMIPSDYFPPG